MALVSIPIEKARIIVPAMRRGIASALNKIMRKSATESSKQVRKVYNIKARDINTATKFSKANANKNVASFYVLGKRIKLLYFGARETNITVSQKSRGGKVFQRRAKQVSVEVKKGHRKIVKSGFVGRTQSGYVNIFKREGKERLPIQSRTSLDVATMYNSEGEKAVEKVFNKDFFKIMEHEIEFRLSKI